MSNQEIVDQAVKAWMELWKEIEPETLTTGRDWEFFLKGFELASKSLYTSIEVKDIATKFCYRWWNTKGIDTIDDFDEWWKTYEGRKATISTGEESSEG